MRVSYLNALGAFSLAAFNLLIAKYEVGCAWLLVFAAWVYAAILEDKLRSVIGKWP